MKGGRAAMEALLCCKIYVSESRNQKALDAIAAVAADHSRQAPLLNVFPDNHYNRVGYTVAARSFTPLSSHQETSSASPLKAAVLEIVGAALSHIDLREHCGSHPRLGVIDHICFHPLASASLSAASTLASSVASHIGSQFAVPTFLYGAAHPENRPLDSIRRALGYFSPNSDGQWSGSAGSKKLDLGSDFGPNMVHPKSGVVVVGACPWVANYNVPVLSKDLQLGRRIAKKVSSRGGGLHAVQAMALLHGHDKIEIACNLTDIRVTSAVQVQQEVSRLAELEGVSTLNGYFTDFAQDEIVDMAMQKLCQ
ncbi:hypothetical protein KP509_11G034800 [Ceratopteris richardii]|uniref:glutamate formimidoyltransferase n=1 Tax=Ceratopteris richardii TaxID=49495 RepID=A0A8T2TQE8_CERRI|nr:hypothetical protein KP509_11G034800 [Ceratopteris richardii]